MTRKAEQVPAVVHELVDIHARDDRGGAFFSADEVDGQQQQQPAEHGPGRQFPERDGRGRDDGINNGVVHDVKLRIEDKRAASGGALQGGFDGGDLIGAEHAMRLDGLQQRLKKALVVVPARLAFAQAVLPSPRSI